MKKLFCLLFLFFAFPVYAVQILATVQDEIITDLDVAERTELMLKMMNKSENVELSKKILDDLINEKIKILSAQNKGISLSEAEIQEGISFLERQNQMPQGYLKDFIAANNLSMDTLRSQIISDLMWMRYIQSENVSPVTISDAQIDEELKRMRQEFMQENYLLAEIYIPFGDNESAAEQEINVLFNRIVDGELFTDLAKQYSKGKTAHLMGDLGWVKKGIMEKAVDDVLPQLKTGQLSKPIKGEKGFYLILMRENQPALDSDVQEFVQVVQLIINAKEYPAMENTVKNAANSCVSFAQFSQKNGLPGSNSGPLPEMLLKRMPADLQNLIQDRKIGELVGPVEMSPYMLFVMKCGSTTTSVLPDKEKIKELLIVKQMEEKSDKSLKEQRQKMIVKVK